MLINKVITKALVTDQAARITLNNLVSIASWCQGEVIRPVFEPDQSCIIVHNTITNRNMGLIGMWIVRIGFENLNVFQVGIYTNEEFRNYFDLIAE